MWPIWVSWSTNETITWSGNLSQLLTLYRLKSERPVPTRYVFKNDLKLEEILRTYYDTFKSLLWDLDIAVSYSFDDLFFEYKKTFFCGYLKIFNVLLRLVCTRKKKLFDLSKKTKIKVLKNLLFLIVVVKALRVIRKNMLEHLISEHLLNLNETKNLNKKWYICIWKKESF